MQLKSIAPCPMTCYLGEETNTRFTPASFQAVVESNNTESQNVQGWKAPL